MVVQFSRVIVVEVLLQVKVQLICIIWDSLLAYRLVKCNLTIKSRKKIKENERILRNDSRFNIGELLVISWRRRYVCPRSIHRVFSRSNSVPGSLIPSINRFPMTHGEGGKYERLNDINPPLALIPYYYFSICSFKRG